MTFLANIKYINQSDIHSSCICKTYVYFQPLFQSLLRHFAIFWTEAKGGKWVTLSEAHFMEEDIKMTKSDVARDTARSFLANVGLSTSQIPDNLMKAILHYKGELVLRVANPEVLRKLMKKNPSRLECQTRENKLLLLEYSLSDGNFSQVKTLFISTRFC